MIRKTEKPPTHLGRESKQIWKKLVEEYSVDDIAGLKILQAALESRDRAEAARKQINKDGLTFLDKAGQLKSHPLLPAERDNRAAFLSALKNLNLDLEPLAAKPGRPPGR